MTSSLTHVMKNVYSYLHILQEAHSNSVNSWDETSLQNALEWARYCEQVYEMSLGKPYQNILNDQIKQLGLFPWSIGDAEVDLQLLNNAVQHLREVLLQNPRINHRVYGKLLESFGNKGKATCYAIAQSCYSSAHSKAVLNLITQHLKDQPWYMKGSEKDLSTRVKATFLIKWVSKVLHNDVLSVENRGNVCKKLRIIAEETDGMVILISALNIDGNSLEKAKEFILNWLVEQLGDKGNQRGSKMLSQVPSKILAVTATNYSLFKKVYVNILHTCGDTMEPDYYNPNKQMGRLYSWKSRTTSMCSYTELLTFVGDLVDSDVNFLQLLRDWASKKECCIWKDVIKDLNDEELR